MARLTSSQAALNEFLRAIKPNYRSRTLPFYVNGKSVGVVRFSDCSVLVANAPGTFLADNTKVEIHQDTWKSSAEITQGLAAVLNELRRKEVFICLKGWRDELIEVSRKFGDKPMFLIERSASSLFGLKRYGVHINGFVRRDDEIDFVWLQRRSRTKQQFPGLLDIIVSGGLEAGLTPLEALRKECFEEASITEASCIEHVKSAGTVSFVYDDDLGTHPLTFFCYDADLPADFVPKANDGEVEEFVKTPIADLLELALNPARFKATSAPTVLDFLIRHHVIDASYGSVLIDTASAIHQNLQEHYPVCDHCGPRPDLSEADLAVQNVQC